MRVPELQPFAAGTAAALLVASMAWWALSAPVLVDPGMGIKNLGRCLAEAQPEAFIGITKAHVARALFCWGKRSIRKLVTVGRRFGWGGDSLKSVSDRGRIRQSAAMGSPFNSTLTTLRRAPSQLKIRAPMVR